MRNMQPIEIAVHRFGGDGPGLVLLHSLTGASGTMTALAEGTRQPLHRRRCRSAGLRLFPPADARVRRCYVDGRSVDRAGRGRAQRGVRLRSRGRRVHRGRGAPARTRAAAGVSGVAFGPGEPAVLDAVVAAGDAGESVESLLADISGCEVTGADLTSPVVPRAVRAWQAYRGPADPTPLRGSLLVLAGTRDTFTPPAAPGGASALAAAAGVRLVSLAAGHDLPRERPNEVAAALTSFLNDRR